MATPYKPVLFRAVWLTEAIRVVLFETCGLLAAVAAVFMIMFGQDVPFLLWAGWSLVVILGLGVIALTVANANTEHVNQEVFVREWIDAAGSSEEKASRQRIVKDVGFAGALASAGSMAMGSTLMDGHAFNIDGTAMMGTFDTNGNVFGVTENDTGTWNTDTGHFGTDDTSYMTPMGMDDPTQT